MDPLTVSSIGAAVRWILTLAGWEAARAADVSLYVNMLGATLSVSMLLWSLWQKYQMHVIVMTAADDAERSAQIVKDVA